MAAVSELGAVETTIDVGGVRKNSDTAVAAVSVTLDLGDVGEVSWDTALRLVDIEDEGWRLDWSEAALHPALPEGGSLRRVTLWPERASILGSGGRPLIGAVDTIRVGIELQRQRLLVYVNQEGTSRPEPVTDPPPQAIPVALRRGCRSGVTI